MRPCLRVGTENKGNVSVIMFKMVGRSHAVQQGSHGRFTGIGKRKVRKGDREVGREGIEEKERQEERQEMGKAYPFKMGSQRMCTGVLNGCS